MSLDELQAAARAVPVTSDRQLLFSFQQRVLSSAASLQGLEAYMHSAAAAAMAAALVQVRGVKS